MFLAFVLLSGWYQASATNKKETNRSCVNDTHNDTDSYDLKASRKKSEKAPGWRWSVGVHHLPQACSLEARDPKLLAQPLSLQFCRLPLDLPLYLNTGFALPRSLWGNFWPTELKRLTAEGQQKVHQDLYFAQIRKRHHCSTCCTVGGSKQPSIMSSGSSLTCPTVSSASSWPDTSGQMISVFSLGTGSSSVTFGSATTLAGDFCCRFSAWALLENRGILSETNRYDILRKTLIQLVSVPQKSASTCLRYTPHLAWWQLAKASAQPNDPTRETQKING